MLVAFDTSTAIASFALYGANGLLAETTWLAHRDQTAQLLPAVQRMLQLQDVTPADLSGVAVALGPGSFNGLRVGVSTAKGLALALGLPLFGFSSLDILAYQHSYLNGNLWATLEIGRGRLGAASYKIKNGTWKRQGDYLNLTVQELAEKTTQAAFFAGELTTEQHTYLAEALPKLATILGPAMGLRRAGYLAEMAWQHLLIGSTGDDIANLQPLYLHQPVPAK
jgi:tRNA threonylcarbamoyladenosine biosynthesis protein TsaB